MKGENMFNRGIFWRGMFTFGKYTVICLVLLGLLVKPLDAKKRVREPKKGSAASFGLLLLKKVGPGAFKARVEDPHRLKKLAARGFKKGQLVIVRANEGRLSVQPYGSSKTMSSKIAGGKTVPNKGAIGRVNNSGKSMVDDMTSMNKEFLDLQSRMQNESRSYQTLSNAIKDSHDAAMSSVRNPK